MGRHPSLGHIRLQSFSANLSLGSRLDTNPAIDLDGQAQLLGACQRPSMSDTLSFLWSFLPEQVQRQTKTSPKHRTYRQLPLKHPTKSTHLDRSGMETRVDRRDWAADWYMFFFSDGLRICCFHSRFFSSRGWWDGNASGFGTLPGPACS